MTGPTAFSCQLFGPTHASDRRDIVPHQDMSRTDPGLLDNRVEYLLTNQSPIESSWRRLRSHQGLVSNKVKNYA